MSILWGDENSLVSQESATTQLYLGALRKHNEDLVLITNIDRESATAECVHIPNQALLQPEWWENNALSAKTSSRVPWKELDKLPERINNEIMVWPPLPVIMSGLISDFSIKASLRQYIPTVLTFLQGCIAQMKETGDRDTLVVLPRIFGAPHIAWHRNGRCVAGIQLSTDPANPQSHDRSCPYRASQGQNQRETSTSQGGIEENPTQVRGTAQRQALGNDRRLNVFRQYVTETSNIFRRFYPVDNLEGALPARLIEVFLNEQCQCASLPLRESDPTVILLKPDSSLAEQLEHKVSASLRRTESTHKVQQIVTQPQANAHARRLARYGLTAVRKEPREISKAASSEINRLSKSLSKVMIRFGPAGSGKTSLLAKLAARLSLQGKRVAIVTFTQASQRVAESRVENETIANRGLIDYFKITDLPSGKHKAWVIQSVLKDRKQLSSEDFTQRMFVQVMAEHQDDDAENNSAKLYDALLVDEAEDFTSEMWAYLLGRDNDANWEGGRDISQICVVFDDAQSALGGSNGIRSFESQAPTQWSTLVFGNIINPADETIRSEFLTKVDYAWLTHNVRQQNNLAIASSEFRSSFRKNDPHIEPGFVGTDAAAIESVRPKSLSELLEYVKSKCASTEDVIVVCPDRLTVAAITLWLDHPGQLVTQSEFLEDSQYSYAKPRGDLRMAGVWLEAPEPKVTSFTNQQGVVMFADVKPENICDYSHLQLVRLDQASKDSVNPTDNRTRVLTFAAARGHEADTALVLIPAEDWFKPELEYIGISRPQKRLIRVYMPPVKQLLRDDASDAGRLFRILDTLRVGVGATGAVWPRLQVDVWRWQRETGLRYLESEAPKKILEWFESVRKELEKKPEWRGKTHCFDDVYTANEPKGSPPDRWRDYSAWLARIRSQLTY